MMRDENAGGDVLIFKVLLFSLVLIQFLKFLGLSSNLFFLQLLLFLGYDFGEHEAIYGITAETPTFGFGLPKEENKRKQIKDSKKDTLIYIFFFFFSSP
jgi:hypothetical protein